jgi:hypothetical protein
MAASVVLWSEFLATDPEAWVQFPALPDFLTRGTLSHLSTIEKLLERKSSGSGLENRDYGRSDTSRSPRDSLYPQKLALTSSTSGCRSVSIVCSRTQATEFSLKKGYIRQQTAFSSTCRLLTFSGSKAVRANLFYLP